MTQPLRVVAPTGEPVTLVEMKSHLRVDTSADDTYITALITAVRMFIEDLGGITLMPTTWEFALREFPSYAIELPRPPVVAVSSVKYTPYGGSEQTVNSANYAVDILSAPARILLTKTGTWPSDELTTVNGVKVRYTAGYADAASVPDVLKHAIKLLAGHWYENREEVITGTIITSIPLGIYALIQPHRVMRF
jgi:uncharacterized phiE125 gp8 family phage protein